MLHQSRRSFLKAGAGAAGLGLIGQSAILDTLSAQVHEPVSDRLAPFPLASVRLAPGIVSTAGRDQRALPRFACGRSPAA